MMVAFFFERQSLYRCAWCLHRAAAGNMKRWLLILGLVGFGLVLGVILGLFLGWIAWPTEFESANPAMLAEEYKQEYILMIAADYALTGDLEAARQRIRSLGEGSEAFLFSFTLDQILQSRNQVEMRQLSQLANDLGQYSPAMAPYLQEEDGS